MVNTCIKQILTMHTNSCLPVTKTFMYAVGLWGTLSIIIKKSLAYYLKISLLLHSTFINSTGIVNNPLNASTELGTSGRHMVTEDSVLFGQGNHHKAMPSTQSQCNLTRTECPAGTSSTSFLGDWHEIRWTPFSQNCSLVEEYKCLYFIWLICVYCIT